MKSYTVSFSVSERLLPTIVSLLVPEIGNLSIKQNEQVVLSNGPDVEVMMLPRLPKFTKGKNDEFTVDEVTFSVFKDNKPYKLVDVRKALAAAKWNPNSATPSLSTLARQGKIKRVERGIYAKA